MHADSPVRFRDVESHAKDAAGRLRALGVEDRQDVFVRWRFFLVTHADGVVDLDVVRCIVNDALVRTLLHSAKRSHPQPIP
eukprot:11210189-Lingulodinium_polyedra.AAC.1